MKISALALTLLLTNVTAHAERLHVGGQYAAEDIACESVQAMQRFIAIAPRDPDKFAKVLRESGCIAFNDGDEVILRALITDEDGLEYARVVTKAKRTMYMNADNLN